MQTTPVLSGKRYTVPELAELTNMSAVFWRKAILRGEIQIERYGRAVRVSQAALNAYLEQATQPAAKEAA